MEAPNSPKSLPLRIEEGLERLATVMRATDWQNARALHVNPAQFAILKLLDTRPFGLSVKDLAALLLVSQPSATDSIAALERKGLVEKRPDPADLRSVRILATENGRAALAAGEDASGPVGRAASALPPVAQQQMLLSLIAMIAQLQDAGAIPIQRMCVDCRYFSPFAHDDADNPHHCHFVDAAFGQRDLRIDCREHETADPSLRAATWSAFSKDHPNPPGK